MLRECKKTDVSNSSDNEKSQAKPEDLLSSLNLGPAWARDTDTKSSKKSYANDPRGEDRGERRRTKGNNFKGKDRRGPRDRRGPGGKGKFDRNDRRDFRKPETPAPDYVTAEVMPYEEGLDIAAKDIIATARTQEVFYLAKLILNARERFRVNFKSSVKEKNLYFCRKDGSVWLSRDEALTQFKRSAWKKDFYEEVVSECEPPKGSFSAVAKCSISGELLGPPNYHGYQERLHALHAQRFSNMPIERYRSKIITEKGEEIVEEWLKSMSQKTRYRPYGEDKNFSQQEKEAAKSKDVEDVEEATGDADVVLAPENSEAVEQAKSTEEGAAPEPFAEVEQESAEATRPPQDEEVLLESLNEVERHFIEHHFDQAFSAQEHAYVPGDIAGKLLSPGLLTLLKVTVSEERRYPGKLAAFMCRQLSGRHLAIFKWKGKLKAGPARPHAVPEDVPIADRPLQILNWLRQNSGKGIDKLWDAVLEKDTSDEDKKAWYSDLHWLINQGYVLFMHDGILHLSKPATQPQQKAKAAEVKAEVKTEDVTKSPEAKPEEGA